MHNEIDDKEAHEETREKYLRLETDLVERLNKVREVLTALGEESAEDEISVEGVIPAIFDIQQYLEECGKPCHQREIVKTVGERRKQTYPHLKHPYSDVWKSLEYHNRYGREVVCVEIRGGKIVRAELKPKPKRRRIKGGGIDRADFYETPDNFFGMKIWIDIEAEGD